MDFSPSAWTVRPPHDLRRRRLGGGGSAASVQGTGLWHCAAPVLTDARPPNGPTTGGSMVTLSGSNFGPTGTSPTTSIGATQCTTSIWISTTSIECMLPAGMGAQAAVVASISSSASLIGTLRGWLTYDGALLTLLCSGEHRMRTDQRRSERSRRGRCDLQRLCLRWARLRRMRLPALAVAQV